MNKPIDLINTAHQSKTPTLHSFEPCAHPVEQPLFSFGVIADTQYADQPSVKTRFYSQAKDKLQTALEKLNRNHPAFILNLGDLINRDFKSLEILLPILATSRAPIHHVLGNHDLLVDDSRKDAVPGSLSIPERRESFVQGKWRFLVLDGNGYGIETWPANHPNRRRGEDILRALEREAKPYAQMWNGAVDDPQLNWLDEQLKTAQNSDQSVALCCHFPVLPESRFNLWNREALLARIRRFPCIKLFLSGHNHAGDFIQSDGVHHITFKGMVETETENSFAWAEVYPDRLKITGFGRETNRTLQF